MNLLDKDQVELIKADVENARLTLVTLSQELVDHICCEVENEMTENGKSFEEAYSLIKNQTGIHVLQKIQENTLYLTDKNFALMKTIMKITGNIALVLLGIGTVLKVYHWPGAGPALLLGFVILCLVFFPSAIYLNYKEGKTKGSLLLNISILLGGIILMAGILFKIMHWPGASPLMILGWSLGIFVFLPVLLYVKLKETTTKSDKRIYILGAISLMIFELATMFKMMHWPGAAPLILIGSFMLISIFLPMFSYSRFKDTGKVAGQFIFLITLSMYAIVLTSLLAMNVSKNILGIFINEESNSLKIVHYFEKKESQIYFNSRTDSLNAKSGSSIKNISSQADNLKNIIEHIKVDLIQSFEQVDKQEALIIISNPDNMNSGNNYGLVIYDNKSKLLALKEQLNAFKKGACSVVSSDPVLTRNISLLLDTSDKQNGTESRSWEDINFSNNMIINTMAVLSTIEKNIRMVESESIRHIQQQDLQAMK